MITLITGGPGMGKTALTVSMILEKYQGRPIFTNIKELALPHALLPKLDTWTKEVEQTTGGIEHHFTFPAGAIVIIDECQSIYPPRANGAKVPPHVAALATHRHEGLDIILISQGSGLLDSFVHKQVKGGLHIFLHKPLFFRFRYERNERINEEIKSELALCARRKYNIPKHVFHLYKSSELHTKPPKAKLPLAAYLLIASVLGGGGLAYKASSRISSAVNPDEKNLSAIHAVPGAAAPTTSAAMVATGVPARIIEALTPTDDHNPLSAPLYAAVVPSVVAPEVVGCIASKRACCCYSQQQTPVWLPDEQCRQRAAGLYYDPYHQPTQPLREAAGTMPRTTAAATATTREAPPVPAVQNPSAML